MTFFSKNTNGKETKVVLKRIKIRMTKQYAWTFLLGTVRTDIKNDLLIILLVIKSHDFCVPRIRTFVANAQGRLVRLFKKELQCVVRMTAKH
jgi:hypothetical protein